jgi:hypothetical protein
VHQECDKLFHQLQSWAAQVAHDFRALSASLVAKIVHHWVTVRKWLAAENSDLKG